MEEERTAIDRTATDHGCLNGEAPVLDVNKKPQMDSTQPGAGSSESIQLPLRTSTKAPSAPILSVPFEVHNAILTHLPWPTLTNLRLTHRLYAYDLLPPSALPAIHTAHQGYTSNAEHYYLRVLGFANANWTGFTQGWGLDRLRSLSPTLPCYHCLRWLPSSDPKLLRSAFSRGMSTGQRDLGRPKAPSRVCVSCGIRSGFYVRGNRVRYQVVCYGCGELGERVMREQHGNWREEKNLGLLKGVELRWHYFCKACVERGERVVPGSRVEFEHWRKWKKYEKGMEVGKQYRINKGKELRKEKGIDDDQDSAPKIDEKGKARESEVEVYPKNSCPVLKELRMCQCKADIDGKPPNWVLAIENGPWIW